MAEDEKEDAMSARAPRLTAAGIFHEFSRNLAPGVKKGPRARAASKFFLAIFIISFYDRFTRGRYNPIKCIQCDFMILPKAWNNSVYLLVLYFFRLFIQLRQNNYFKVKYAISKIAISRFIRPLPFRWISAKRHVREDFARKYYGNSYARRIKLVSPSSEIHRQVRDVCTRRWQIRFCPRAPHFTPVLVVFSPLIYAARSLRVDSRVSILACREIH